MDYFFQEIVYTTNYIVLSTILSPEAVVLSDFTILGGSVQNLNGSPTWNLEMVLQKVLLDDSKGRMQPIPAPRSSSLCALG